MYHAYSLLYGEEACIIGIDDRIHSARSIIVNVSDGFAAGFSDFYYPGVKKTPGAMLLLTGFASIRSIIQKVMDIQK